jgi:hypothetical protein
MTFSENVSFLSLIFLKTIFLNFGTYFSEGLDMNERNFLGQSASKKNVFEANIIQGNIPILNTSLLEQWKNVDAAIPIHLNLLMSNTGPIRRSNNIPP